MMDEFKEQSNAGRAPEAREELAAELKRLYRAWGEVPAEIDRAILDRARKHFADPRGLKTERERRVIRVVWRWAARAATIAAAAMIVFMIYPTRVSERPAEEPLQTARQEKGVLREDIDQNGRVDILDAFAMARRLEGEGDVDARWDFNHDTVVDGRDVNLVACAAVRIPEGG